MKKMFFILILQMSCVLKADPTLYQKIKDRYDAGHLPNLELFASPLGHVSPGRCVESARPNSIYAAYFAANVINNDPFVKFAGFVSYYPNVDPNYYDHVVEASHYKISRERAPLVQQNDGRSFIMEPASRDWITLRSHRDVLLIEIQLFQQDQKVLCYFTPR